jgi:hypothetical protein
MTWFPAAAFKNYMSAVLEGNANHLAADTMQKLMDLVDKNDDRG